MKERIRESRGWMSTSEMHVSFNYLNAITPLGAPSGVLSLNIFVGLSINIPSTNLAIRDTFPHRYNYICRLPLAEIQNYSQKIETSRRISGDAKEWIRNEGRYEAWRVISVLYSVLVAELLIFYATYMW